MNNKTNSISALVLTVVLIFCSSAHSASPVSVWPSDKANAWYQAIPWAVGSNFITSNAINQLEMWQAESFDAARIEKELKWGEKIKMSTMRVFLHNLPWEQNPTGFKERIGRFLKIAAKHHIRPIFVLFDSCWNPNPVLGRQPLPTPGVHNSGWVQSPALKQLESESDYGGLKSYVEGIIEAFGSDERILAWDVWNEPDNLNESSYDDPRSKLKFVQNLLPQVFEWARSKNPTQPLTSGIWKGDWSSDRNFSAIEKIQIDNSDIITFHNYGNAEDFEKRIGWLRRYDRPILCTEYMARPRGSTFESILPIAKKYHVAAYNWGFVAGKTQTYFPWDSWQKPYKTMPKVWFHDIFNGDGTPYIPAETRFISKIINEK